MPILAWNAPLIPPIFSKRSTVFPILLFSSISLHRSLRKAFLSLLAILWNSTFKWIYLSFYSLTLVSPGISWLPTFAFQSPIIKRTSFLVLVLGGLVGLLRTIQLQLLQCYWFGHRLGLLWYWMVCLGYEQRSFCCFWDCIQVLHFGLFCWLSISSKGFLPTVVDIMVFWVKFTYSSPF